MSVPSRVWENLLDNSSDFPSSFASLLETERIYFRWSVCANESTLERKGTTQSEFRPSRRALGQAGAIINGRRWTFVQQAVGFTLGAKPHATSSWLGFLRCSVSEHANHTIEMILWSMILKKNACSDILAQFTFSDYWCGLESVFIEPASHVSSLRNISPNSE